MPSHVSPDPDAASGVNMGRRIVFSCASRSAAKLRSASATATKHTNTAPRIGKDKLRV